MKKIFKNIIILLVILNLITLFLIYKKTKTKHIDFEKRGLIPLKDYAQIDTKKLIINGKMYSIDELEVLEKNDEDLDDSNTEIVLKIKKQDELEIIFPGYTKAWYIDSENKDIEYERTAYLPKIYVIYNEMIIDKGSELKGDHFLQNIKYNIKTNGTDYIRFVNLTEFDEEKESFKSLRDDFILKIVFE